MNLKKFFATLALSFIALTSTFSSASAGAGEWDNMGTYALHNTSQSYIKQTLPSLVKSSGGDFKACVKIKNPEDYYIMVKLYEYDPANADENVGSGLIGKTGGCKTFSNIGKYVDGTNKKAEFYVKVWLYSNNSGSVTFYD